MRLSAAVRILIVDDDKMTLSVTRRILASVGYQLLCTESSAEGLRLARQYKPDLILLDVGMPDISGLEICKQIKADPELRGIFVILLSGLLTDNESQAALLESGADSFIARPIPGRELILRVQLSLRLVTAEKALQEYNLRLEREVEARTWELRQAQERLIRQERLAALGQLAGGIGHELRNPLAVISNAVYFLKLIQPEASEKVKEYLGIVEGETRAAEKIITDLLDFSRLKPAGLESTSLADLIQRVMGRYPPPEKVCVMLSLPTHLPSILVDPQQIAQVLGNLVLNAFQAMPAGGELTLSAEMQGPFVALAIKDCGMGISAENMRRLFEPLFTTKARGIGLGLALSKKLVEANGGKIEVQSEPGKGSIFTLFLPVVNQPFSFLPR